MANRVPKRLLSSSSPIERVQAVVIGAGVVGLAVARALAQRGDEVFVLEQRPHVGMETSSRNSEVIHGGLYYPPLSYKARFCVEGKETLYRYCRERAITVKQCGKLIVASHQDQLASTLRQLQAQATDCGVETHLLSQFEVQGMEPSVVCEGALWSPSTGIVDSHALMQSLLGDAQAAGATLVLQTVIQEARLVGDRVQLGTRDMWLDCDMVVNCAGLWADVVARQIHAGHTWQPPRQYYAKGNYFALQGCRSPFTHLIYPVPERGGLGVHATIDTGGRTKFGPDVEWLEMGQDPDTIDYQPNPSRLEAFYTAIRKYWPDLPDDSLVPDYAGVRPKLNHPDIAPIRFDDFAILGPDQHGVPGLVHLMGIESPGLTSALAIAKYVAVLLHHANG